jgi:ferritin-like metal-binding protein YciE
MSKLASLDDLLVHELQDIYNAEGQILKALPRMIRAASHPDLRDSLEEHLQQTVGQVRRLEQAFKLLGVPSKGKQCDGMAGLLEESRKIMEEHAEAAVMDAALIAAAQKVEHYEIATYGTVIAWAEAMGHDKAARLLKMTLGEEESADEKLSSIATAGINQQAASDAHDEEEEERAPSPTRSRR